MKNCTIYDITQGTGEWHGVRASCFTASEFAPFFLESRTETQKKARENLIVQKVRERLHRAGIVYDEWELAAIEKDKRLGDFNLDVKRGNEMEATARDAYEVIHDCDVAQVGFIFNHGGYGCSPDGIAMSGGPDPFETHGLEIKCPSPERFIKYLRRPADLYEQYAYQVHGSMCVTGFDRWDLFGFCNGFPPIHHVVARDGFTERLNEGILGMVAEMEDYQEWLSEQFANWKK